MCISYLWLSTGSSEYHAVGALVEEVCYILRAIVRRHRGVGDRTLREINTRNAQVYFASEAGRERKGLLERRSSQ